jgi:hypothetical protein
VAAKIRKNFVFGTPIEVKVCQTGLDSAESIRWELDKSTASRLFCKKNGKKVKKHPFLSIKISIFVGLSTEARFSSEQYSE